MNDLRERFAKRLWDIDPRRWPNKPDLIIGGFAETDIRGAGGLTYGILADECIRQMEWARNNCVDVVTRGREYEVPSMGGGTEITWSETHEARDLTLAPDSWTPEGKD